MLTVFQIIGVSAAYFGVTLLLPWILLRRRLETLRTSARFMVYFLTGNFYCMNLVLILQLFHIYRFRNRHFCPSAALLLHHMYCLSFS